MARLASLDFEAFAEEEQTFVAVAAVELVC